MLAGAVQKNTNMSALTGNGTLHNINMSALTGNGTLHTLWCSYIIKSSSGNAAV